MKEIPNLSTTLIVVPNYESGKWFIRENFHVIEQRNSHNFIVSYPEDITKAHHFRIITTPNQLYGQDFHDYILHGCIDDLMLTALDHHSWRMKKKFNLGID